MEFTFAISIHTVTDKLILKKHFVIQGRLRSGPLVIFRKLFLTVQGR